MAPRGNNMIPNGHFHKKWQRFVKTWFDQPMRKVRRQRKRNTRNKNLAPKPAQPLRPIVHCPTFRYNNKVRLGRGFTLDELREADLNQRYARSVGIAVDHRRRNESVEMMQRNVQRLKEYKQRLIVFPFKKKGMGKELDLVKQVDLKKVFKIGSKVKRLQTQKVTRKMKKFQAFTTLRQATTEGKVLQKHNKKNLAKNELEGKL